MAFVKIYQSCDNMKIKNIKISNGVVEGTNVNIKPFFMAGYDKPLLKKNEYINGILKGKLLVDNIKYMEIDGKYFAIDGHYMIQSILNYIDNYYSINKRFFNDLKEEQKNDILNTEVTFEYIDMTETLLPTYLQQIRPGFYEKQEINNSLFYGPWLDDMIRSFASVDSPYIELLNKYIYGNLLRCQKMERCIKMVCNDRPVNQYMALQYTKPDASEFIKEVITMLLWFDSIFGKILPDLSTARQINIGNLYRKYHKNAYDLNVVRERLLKALEHKNEATFKMTGVFEYALSKKINNQIIYKRFFPQSFIVDAYVRNNICAICGKPIESLDDAQGDHIIPWIKGGETTPENFQLAHKICNIKKGIKC